MELSEAIQKRVTIRKWKSTPVEKEKILNNETRKNDLRENPGLYQRNELIFSDIFVMGKLN